MKNYRNTGWCYYPLMDEIYPIAGSTGGVAWRGSCGTLGPMPPPTQTPHLSAESGSSDFPPPPYSGLGHYPSHAAASAPTPTTSTPTITVQPATGNPIPQRANDNSEPAMSSTATSPPASSSVGRSDVSAGKKRAFSAVQDDSSLGGTSGTNSSPLFARPAYPQSSSSIPSSALGRSSKRS